MLKHDKVQQFTEFRRRLVKDGFMRNSSFTYNYTGRNKLLEIVDAHTVNLYIKPVDQGFVHLAVFLNEEVIDGKFEYIIGSAVTFSRDDIIYGERQYWKEINTIDGVYAYETARAVTNNFTAIASARSYVRKRFPGPIKPRAKVRAFLRCIKHYLTRSF